MPNKILVVDDIPPNLKLIAKYFEILGCEGVYVGGAQEAMAELRKDKFHLVFMDIQMPGMDGIQATRVIRNEIDAQIPIIALTGSATQGQLQNALELGMNHYCMKPISIDDVEEIILKFAKK